MQPAGTFNMSYSQDMAIVRTRFQWGASIVFLIFLFTLPLYANDYWLGIINNIAIIVIALLGLNILTGYCGQISIGHSAFVAIGAYTAAILTSHLGFSAWAALPCSILTASLIGLLFGLPALRVKGFYLAMTTLGAWFIITWIITHGEHFGIPSGGVYGLAVARPTLGNIVINTKTEFFYMIMAFTLIAVFLAKNLTRTRIGRAFVAIRDNDLAAEVLGINLSYYKLLAFFIACAFAGVAGWLKVHSVAYASVEHYPLMDSIWWLGMLIVGGLGSTMGVIYGTVFIMLLWEGAAILSPVIGSAFPGVAFEIFASSTQILTGLVIALFIVFEPRGINHRWQIFKSYYRLWPFPY
jgi:branched-chain amino acid transport system permease protein